MMLTMGWDESDGAGKLAKQVASRITGATVRKSDVSGAAAVNDPRLLEQLDVIVGRRLSQFSMGGCGIRLAFWGDVASDIGRELIIEHQTVSLRQPGQKAVEPHVWNEDLVATSLLATLEHRVTAVDLDGGHLALTFDGGQQLQVEPDEHYESWQITSEDGLFIVCTPGGELTVWYPTDET